MDKPKAPQTPILVATEPISEVVTKSTVVGIIYAINPSVTAVNGMIFTITDSHSPFTLSPVSCVNLAPAGQNCTVTLTAVKNILGGMIATVLVLLL